MWKIILIGVFGFFTDAVGQTTYRIADIPPELKKGANAVFFEDEGVFEIVNNQKAIFRTRLVIAILNSKADYLSSKTVYYDNSTKVTSFQGRVFDQFGKQIYKSRKSDFYDRSAVFGATIYEDSRLINLDLEQNRYPYIVEFTYEKEYDITYIIPDWYTLSSEEVSVLESKYTVISPKDLEPNFKLVNTDQVMGRVESEEKVSNSISFQNITAIKKEPFGPEWDELVPVLYVQPSNFNFDGYQGDLSSWESFGKWILKLNHGKNDLSEASINEIRSLVDNESTIEEKARIVYEYVQNNTRYVSIQLGIGGYQPFSASTVDELGYGDCKALSNYTYSLLEGVGVKSHYTLVYAGERIRELDTEFASSSFNHAILCVPNDQDTIWLECTSQANPFGYQGDFTGDRDVMIVTENGGEIVHTNIYKGSMNLKKSIAEVKITEEGHAVVQLGIEYNGLRYEDDYLNQIVNDGDEALKKWMYNHTGIAEFRIESLDFKVRKERIPSIKETAHLKVYSLVSVNGKRLFLKPNLMNRLEDIPVKMENRKTDLVLKRTYEDLDSIAYNIPEKYHVEFLLEPVELNSEFGSYRASFEYKNGQLVYVRDFKMKKSRFSKESYMKFHSFCKEIAKHDQAKVVLLDKT